MAIKWKNKVVLLAWILLFTYGLSSLSLGLFHGSEYLKKNYFETPNFESQLGQFIDYLSVYELNYINKEEAKKGITVTQDEIQEHRYRYGDLTEQITTIKAQYEPKIQEALGNNSSELADFLTAERDSKIQDITENFRSDDHIRGKIVKEKEEKIDNYYRELDNMRSEFERYKMTFKYNLKNTTTGAVYTNLSVSNDDVIDAKKMIFIRSYPSPKYGYLSTSARPGIINNDFEGLPMTKKAETFEGEIAIPQSSATGAYVLPDYYDFQQRQKIFFIYVMSGILAFLLSLYVNRRKAIIKLEFLAKWQGYYNRIPIEIAVVSFGFIGLITWVFLLNWDGALYLHQYLYDFLMEIFSDLMLLALLTSLTLIQGKMLLERVRDWSKIEAEIKMGLLYRAYNGIKEMFLNRTSGTQIFLLLTVVFASGVGAAAVIIEPRLILIYTPLFIAITIPVSIVIVKQTGYFNRIVNSISELASGNFEPEIKVEGNSVMAKLADNINILRYGVKTSQKEQAKSERLKAELITNVSHDLRTPLTSIITYTELLKTPGLSTEDREAYIEIIDRKSKRLKVLIDDLFEASKMASGNIELVKEKVDVVQLLQQALAEYNETISQSTLQFRVTNPDKPVYAIVDGQKLWRVFDNLIGNILKYTLDNTRVYISVKTIKDKAVITFKNVTKYELSEDIDELFERFKRGDTSRNTEGSGLGLAIAKSIVDLHGGKLDIEVDGDLFKITITFDRLLNNKEEFFSNL